MLDKARGGPGQVGRIKDSAMGGSICKCDDKKNVDANEETVQGDEKVVHFRRTVHETEIEVSAEDAANRKGAADPDLDKLRQQAADREAGKVGGLKKKSRPSITEEPAEEIARSDEAEPPVVAQKRSKDRKGTGFVHKNAVPDVDDEEEEEEEAAEAPAASAAKSKEVPLKEEAPPVIAPAPKRGNPDPSVSRVKARKGTGFVKKGMLPVDDDEDEDE